MWHRHSCLCEVWHDSRSQALMGAGSGRGTDKSVCATLVPRLWFKVRLGFKCCEKCRLAGDRKNALPCRMSVARLSGLKKSGTAFPRLKPGQRTLSRLRQRKATGCDPVSRLRQCLSFFSQTQHSGVGRSESRLSIAIFTKQRGG